ncbi:MAG: glycosyl transferase family 1 [Patescibacteria group bacterium]|nr:MAG: glycosyl transferase family 1 [Patescibacteria group bacterium]
MIIGIDGNEANVEKKVGVSTYTLNLLYYFKKKADKNTRFFVYLKKPANNLPEPSKYFQYKIVKGSFLWSQIFLPLYLRKHKEIDVLFSPAHYIPRFLNIPSVVTIHDLSYLYYPQDFLKKDLYQLKNWTEYSLKKAKKIIAVSKTTKKDIIKNYSIPEEKITVIYNGFEKNIKYQIKDVKNKKIKNPYILYVGTLQPRKNIETLIKAFEKFKHFYPEFKLTIAGKKGWLYEKIFELVKDLGLENDIYFTDYVTDIQLIFLYKNAFCFVLPSFYEGFGIPILEAMSYSCPVIASFASSLPEVGGDACLYFDPENVFDLVEKLKLLKEDKKLAKDLIKKGYQRIKQFSWKKCADETLEVIKGSILDKDRT